MTASWALVVHTCNPSYSGGRDRGSQLKDNPWQIIRETLSQKPFTKKEKKGGGGAGGGGLSVCPLFNPKYTKKKKKKKNSQEPRVHYSPPIPHPSPLSPAGRRGHG
jgi:hypothetical protein